MRLQISPSRPSTVIIGAGPAGLTAAYEIAREGSRSVQLFEAQSSVGGMAKTLDLWGQKVDIGPHRFFSNDTRVNRLWLSVMGRDYEMVKRLTRIHYRNRFFFYPLRAQNALANLGIFEAARCILSYAWSRAFPIADEKSFEAWVVNRFGHRLYSIFFKSYTEKLWGVPCSALDVDFAAQRIKKLSLYEAIKNAVRGGKDNTHTTLVDEFAYPHGGTGVVYERMASLVKSYGGEVHLRAPVRRVITEGGTVRAVELESGKTVRADEVISSMPITLLVDRLTEAPADVKEAAKKLKFRNTVIIYLEAEASQREFWPDQWLYIHSPDLGVGRITNFQNWSVTITKGKKEAILALEYWCYDEDPIWKASDDVLVHRAGLELEKTGLLQGRKILQGQVYRIPRCYPVYTAGYNETVAVVANYLRSLKGLQLIGRYGAFKYNNQDHSILMGLLASENSIAGKAVHDLWAINTDYEYQEASRISETGLERGVGPATTPVTPR